MSGYPDNNPKTAIGVTKVPLHLVPPSAKHYLALALADGAMKYGPYNWRDAAISVSVYKSALERHVDAFWDGEDLAKDSGIHHIAHAMACCALILDAMTVGRLNDDRPTRGASPSLQAEYTATKAAPKYGELIPHERAKAAIRDGVVFERVEDCGVITAESPPPPFDPKYIAKAGAIPPDDDEGNTPAEAPREHAA